MCSPYFCCVNVTISVLLKSPVILPENESGENNSFISSSSGFQIIYIVFTVRSIAHDEQSVGSSYSFESLDNKVSIIFSLDSRNSHNITLWLDSPLSKASTI